MAYWPFENGLNGIDKAYYLPNINNFLFQVYMESSPFSGLIGRDDSNAICLRTIADSQGGAGVYGRLQTRDYKRPILDRDQVRGVDRFEKTDTITIAPSKITFKIDRRDVSVEQYSSKIHLTEGQAKRLAGDHRQYRDFKIFQSAMTGLYNAATSGSMPRTCRAVVGNQVTGQATDGAYAYAAGATLPATLLASMPDLHKAQHRMSVKHIRRLRQKAIDKFGGDPLQPMEVLQWNGHDEPRFVLYMSPTCAEWLRQDADFISMQLTRGVDLAFQGSPIVGGFFIGRVFDVDCIEVPSMADSDLSIDAKYGWSLLLGRGAFGLFQKTEIKYIEEWDQVEDCMFQVARQHMGIGALVFPATKEVIGANDPVKKVEQGIIHSFTRIDA